MDYLRTEELNIPSPELEPELEVEPPPPCVAHAAKVPATKSIIRKPDSFFIGYPLIFNWIMLETNRRKINKTSPKGIYLIIYTKEPDTWKCSCVIFLILSRFHPQFPVNRIYGNDEKVSCDGFPQPVHNILQARTRWLVPLAVGMILWQVYGLPSDSR